MKYKRRRVVEVPPKIKLFISNVRSSSLENIEETLQSFSWEFEKGDFHHWVELFNHFDSYFEKFIKSRKDLQLVDNFVEADPPFPRAAILQILRVTRIILENCTNKHFYSSYEQHLSSLLSCTDAEVVEETLHTLAVFLRKAVGKCSIRDASLTSKLFAYAQGWGSKEEGLGLVACSLEKEHDYVATQMGPTLHFEFYADGDASTHSSSAEGVSSSADALNQGLQIIHLPNINSHEESDLELLNKLIKEHKVPYRLCFSLLTRLRFARAFSSLPARQQYICIRLYAFMALVQASIDANSLSAFFTNEPEFINELVSLLSYEDMIPEKIQVLGILSLASLCQDRSHQSTVLTAVSSGGHRGTLPSLMQKAIDSITSKSGKWSICFAEALLSLVTVLVSSSPGSSALREAGFIPTLLPLLKDTKPQHVHLVSTAIHVLEAFMDYSNPAVALFRDLGGLDDTIARLKLEVSCVENGFGKHENVMIDRKGKQVLEVSLNKDSHAHCSEGIVSYQRKSLIKTLLRAISLGTYAPGSTTRIYGSEENLLPQCLCIIFSRAKDFGGGVFSLATTVTSDLIHKDPTCYAILDAAGLPQAFLNSITSGVLCSAEAISCIPQCLDALCLNSSGLQAVKTSNALGCFVNIFTSPAYLWALSGDTPGSLSSGLDELIRHASSLRSSAVDIFIEILNTIAKLGSGVETSSAESQSSSTFIPMETDPNENNSIHPDEPKSSNTASPMLAGGLPDVQGIYIEDFLPECISNASRLLETVLQNADTCRLFIEKKGIEFILQLFNLPSMPLLASIGQSVAVAFKNLSLLHAVPVARAVCSFLKEHLKSLNELLASVGGSKIVMLEGAMQKKVLSSLSSLEGLLSLSNFLLKATTSMVSELGSLDADIVKDLAKVYKEILWQISLCDDSQIEEDKQDKGNDTENGDGPKSSSVGRENGDEATTNALGRYINPFSVSSTGSQWNVEQELFSVRSAEGFHRHSRNGLSRIRGGRSGRHLGITLVESEGSAMPDISLVQDTKNKSPEDIISELLKKLNAAMRSFHASLVKGLTARRRSDHGSLSTSCRNIATGLAKLFLEALGYSRPTAVFEMSLSVKCRYFGKIVDDMIALIFDSRRRSCNTALVNSFYVNGTFKELLTTFEASSQLLWTLPCSSAAVDEEKPDVAHRLAHSSWLVNTLQSYCYLLAYFVNPSLLLSPSSPSQVQLLVHPAPFGLSIGLFDVPREPETFVRILQSQVLDVVLPIWNHPMFPGCTPTFISSVTCIIAYVYSGVGDVKHSPGGVTGSAGERLAVPPVDEASIASIVEMGFTRARAEEALRSINMNSVELAMDWLFGHPEEYGHEDAQLAQALELSLGSSSESQKEDGNDKIKSTLVEEKEAEIPPVENILSTCMKLFQNKDAVAFHLTDLLVTLCNRNKGRDRSRVALFLIEQLKICPKQSSSQISHILALLLSEDGSTREIAAENGTATLILDVLAGFNVKNGLRGDDSVEKFLSTLFLILHNLMEFNPKQSPETAEVTPESAFDDNSLSVQASIPQGKTTWKDDKESDNVFERILGRTTGYLTFEESQRSLTIACEYLKMHSPPVVMQAVLQLCARLTKSHVLAMKFLENAGLSALFGLPKSSCFPGFDSLTSVIIRHLLEDPQTLQTAMELEIRHSITGALNRHAGRVPPRLFLTSMAPLISRDPTTFMKAANAVCQLDSSGGRINIVLSREKEKEKSKPCATEFATISNDSIHITETNISDAPGKCFKGYKKIPPSLSQVIDQLLEIIMTKPSMEENMNSSSAMDVDVPAVKDKGKSKMGDGNFNTDALPVKSAWLAKMTFVLKLLSDILLMYVHAVGVVLKRDVDMCQRGFCQEDHSTSNGIVHHVLHQLLPLPSHNGNDASNEWKSNLSEKASCFLVVLCGRSAEGRRRVICELVKAFTSFSSLQDNSSAFLLIPNHKVLAFTDLLYSIVSKSSSSSLPSSGCSPDIAKAMIDGGIVHALTNVLQVIDLDHPNTSKVVNLILKALEILTRAANTSQQLYKSDCANKKKPSSQTGRSEGLVHETTQGGDVSSQPDSGNHILGEEHLDQRSSQDIGIQTNNSDQPMEQDMRSERAENAATDMQPVNNVEFTRDEVDGQDTLHEVNGGAMSFQVDHRTDDDMAEEEDDDMGEDAEDDDEDEDEIAEEGAALMSLADTDVEDHDENGLRDEYNDEMIDEDDSDFPENRVIEVRWREGSSILDELRVLHSTDANHFIDVTAEPFQGVNTDTGFRSRRPSDMDRHRHNTRIFLDRSLESSAFQHPLLIRPSQSRILNMSPWPSSGNTSRELDTLDSGHFVLTQFNTFDGGMHSDYPGSMMFGDHLVGSAPPPLIDFSLGADPVHLGARRGPAAGRWSDDGQTQSSGLAATIAQAVENLFISQLRSMSSDDTSVDQRQLNISSGQEMQQQNISLSVSDGQQLGPADDDWPQSEGQIQDRIADSVNQESNLCTGSELLLPDLPHREGQMEVVGEEDAVPSGMEQTSTDALNNLPVGLENVHTIGGASASVGHLDTIPEIHTSNQLQTLDLSVQERFEVFASLQGSEEIRNRDIGEYLLTEINPISNPVHDSDSGTAALNESPAGGLPSAGAGADMDGAGVNGTESGNQVPFPDRENGTLSHQSNIVPQEDNQPNVRGGTSSGNSIDPTFLEALPEDLRAEVLASQQGSQPAQPVPDATYAPPPPEEIDPEFLAALPPDIQAEVLAQQRAQRFLQSQQAEGPVDMDNASILATFPPDLREEVLLTSPDTVLSSLPSNLLAEAQILRDRVASHFHARSSLFGGHRLGSRRLVDRRAVVDRGVGVTVDRRSISAIARNLDVKEVEGIPLMDSHALRTLTRLLRLAQPLGKGLLQRLLLNLCAHTRTRATIICLLLEMIKPEAEGYGSPSSRTTSQRLFGCQWNGVCGLPQPSDGPPPLVSRRVLEILTYLATNHYAVADLLFCFDPLLSTECSNPIQGKPKSIKGKEKVSEAIVLFDDLISFWKEHTPISVFLKLLNTPLFLRSSVHLEQVMCLLQVVIENADSNLHCQAQPVIPAGNSESHPETLLAGGVSVAGGVSGDANGLVSGQQMDTNDCNEQCPEKTNVRPYDTFLELPQRDLRNLCILLSHEGLSDKVYSLAAEVLKKLAFAAPPHQKYFVAELANLVRGLSSPAVNELITLRSMEVLGLTAASMAGAAILRVLQTLGALTSDLDKDKSMVAEVERLDQCILWNLNTALEPLWLELSDCISATEVKLGQISAFSSPVPNPIAGDLVGSSSSLSSPLPPGTQRLLPFIESFFILSEKLHIRHSITQVDADVTAREVMEPIIEPSSPPLIYGGIGHTTFVKFVEKHRRLLNAFIRQNPGLLEKSLNMMLNLPRHIDFDNKRAYFRSRVRQQHDRHPSAPLRISVRRAYVLEDSYNQLRMRSNQDLKGRLTVQFQGEEGIDAGGLTREWYQLLSRVIFDKGALLFTTVGNNATFQPNPNSVYQTEHLSYFKFVGRVVAKALFDGQLLDVYFTRSFYKHILGVKVTYHDIEAVDPDYYKNLKWMLENDVSDIPDLTFSMDADEEKHILYEKTEVMDYELKPGGRNIRVTEDTKHEYVDLVAEHILSTAIRPQINSFLEGFNELIPRDLISIFNDKELELLISGLPEIDLDDLKANTEYTGYTAASCVVQWFWDVVHSFSKEDMARFLQFVTGTSKVPLEGFKALQGISGPQRFQIHKAYGAPERLPSAHTCFNQLDLPEYSSQKQLEDRLLLAIHEASEGFGFG